MMIPKGNHAKQLFAWSLHDILELLGLKHMFITGLLCSCWLMITRENYGKWLFVLSKNVKMWPLGLTCLFVISLLSPSQSLLLRAAMENNFLLDSGMTKWDTWGSHIYLYIVFSLAVCLVNSYNWSRVTS